MTILASKIGVRPAVFDKSRLNIFNWTEVVLLLVPPTSLIAADKRDCLPGCACFYRVILANNYSIGYG